MDNTHAPDPNEVYGSDAEDFDSEESRDSSFSVLSTPTILSSDSVEALSERAAAQSLAATDGSAHGSTFSGRSVSSPVIPVLYNESSNPFELMNDFPQFLSNVHVPVLQEIHTLLSSNAPMDRIELEPISSDEDNDEQRRTWQRLGAEERMKRKHGSPQGSSTAKRSCDGASGSGAKSNEATAECGEEAQRVAQCPVCLEEIDEGGDHRLVALKCGHAFGEICVKKWLKTHKQCCPICKREAKEAHIRVVFLDCCRLATPYELAEARKEASDLRAAGELQKRLLSEREVQLKALRMENARLTEQIQKWTRGLSQMPFSPLSAQTPRQSIFPSFHTFTKFSGQCKYMAYGEHVDMVAVSMKPLSGIFDGFGIGLCSLYDLHSPRSCKIIHRQDIKDLCFHPSRKWLLTASLDNTARISDVDNMNLNSVLNLHLESKVWSCCWSRRNETNFFLGLANGHIVEYDTRQPAEPVHVLMGQTNRIPVTSLKSFEVDTLGRRISGIISPQMRSSVRLYKEDPRDETGYTAQDIPVPGFCFSLFYEKSSSSFLVSSRASNRSVKNEIWKLAVDGDDIVTSCRSNFISGGTASIISKPIMCQSPSGESWACCLDDRQGTIQVFSCPDGKLRHTIETKDPEHVQMTQVERVKLPGRSQFALLGSSKNGFSVYY